MLGGTPRIFGCTSRGRFFLKTAAVLRLHSLGFAAFVLLTLALKTRGFFSFDALGFAVVTALSLDLLLEYVALHVGTLHAHLDVDGTRTTGTAGELNFALLLALQRDLARRCHGAGFLAGLPVTTAQMTQQLELGLVADLVGRSCHLDAGLIELHEQLLDRNLQHLGELGNCYVCHLSRPPRPSAVTRGEPVLAGLHDELAGFFDRQTLDIEQIVYRLLG